MQARSRPSWMWHLFGTIVGLASWTVAGRGDDLPVVAEVEFQPLSAQVKRVVEALDMLGEPLSQAEKAMLDKALDSTGPASAIRAIQQVLDRHCLIGIEINPESRVKAVQGPARPRLVQNGWSVFLIKVHNEAGVTAELAAVSPNADRVYKQFDRPPRPQAVGLAGPDRPALDGQGDVQRSAAEAIALGTGSRVPDDPAL